MNGRTMLVALALFGTVLPGGAIAQSSQVTQRPDGTVVVRPLPAAPADDVEVTGSTAPQVATTPAARRDVRVTVDRPGCDVQTYALGTDRVRVHRC